MLTYKIVINFKINQFDKIVFKFHFSPRQQLRLRLSHGSHTKIGLFHEPLLAASLGSRPLSNLSRDGRRCQELVRVSKIFSNKFQLLK